MGAAVVFAYRGGKVYAKHRERVALTVGVLVWTHFYVGDVHSEQSRQDGAGYALVVHQVLEHHVVNRVGNVYHTLVPFLSVENACKYSHFFLNGEKYHRKFWPFALFLFTFAG